jgi:hypothetical protein
MLLHALLTYFKEDEAPTTRIVGKAGYRQGYERRALSFSAIAYIDPSFKKT